MPSIESSCFMSVQVLYCRVHFVTIRSSVLAPIHVANQTSIVILNPTAFPTLRYFPANVTRSCQNTSFWESEWWSSSSVRMMCTVSTLTFNPTGTNCMTQPFRDPFLLRRSKAPYRRCPGDHKGDYMYFTLSLSWQTQGWIPFRRFLRLDGDGEYTWTGYSGETSTAVIGDG